MKSGDDRPAAILVSAQPEGVTRDFELAAHLDIVAIASDGHAVAKELAANAPSVAAVDMALPDATAPSAIREIASAEPPVGVVALVAAPLGEHLVSRALEAGAHACVTPRTVTDYGSAPFLAAASGQTFLPTDELREMLSGHDLAEPTSKRRDQRLRNLVIGLIPLTGVLVALVELLWRRYLGQIGVRPEDVGVDPTTRLADVFLTVSVSVGLFGPQAFVGSWLELIIDSTNERVAGWLRDHHTISRVMLSALTFLVTAAIAWATQLLFALFVGPFVAALLLAKMFDLDDDLPAALRITRVSPSRAIAVAAVVFAVYLALLSYEVVVRGPQFDQQGEVGWIAPSVFGFNAEPVDVTDLDGASRTDMLYLGGDGDVYLLVDPCDGSRVDFVPVGETRLTVIDRVRCG